jgi:hypothetical protein
MNPFFHFHVQFDLGYFEGLYIEQIILRIKISELNSKPREMFQDSFLLRTSLRDMQFCFTLNWAHLPKKA